MLITERVDKMLTEKERQAIQRRLLRTIDNPLHAEVLLHAAEALESEMNYDDLRARYNLLEECQREGWIAQIRELVDEYEATKEADSAEC